MTDTPDYGTDLCVRLRNLDRLQSRFVDITNKLGNPGALNDLFKWYESFLPPLPDETKKYLGLLDKASYSKAAVRELIIMTYPEFDISAHQRGWIARCDPYTAGISERDEAYIDSKVETLFGVYLIKTSDINQ